MDALFVVLSVLFDSFAADLDFAIAVAFVVVAIVAFVVVVAAAAGAQTLQ